MKTKTFFLNAIAASAIALAAPAAPALAQPGRPGAGALSFAEIVERVGPAVVSIEVTSERPGRASGLPGLPGLPDPPGGQRPQAPPEEARGAGSGFFISADGYIVTNNHVVENAREITVTLQDKRELKATIVGRDEPTDLAVLKVEGRGFPFVSFSTQAKPRVGDWVIAVGNPFGLGGTATAGIVSAYGRDIGQTFVDYIQIDASINRGNSGGPTFDAMGRVIGVNTMIFSPSGGSVGIGFAIPADVADSVTKQLIAEGKISRGYIGATIQTLTNEMAESLGLGERKGALIAEVTAGAPAAQAGLQSGDVVLSVNGRAVETSSQLTRQVGATRTGDTIRLDILRAGAPRTISIKSGVRPSEAQLAGRGEPQTPAPSGASDNARLGLSVRQLEAADRQRLNMSASVAGVYVEKVDANTDAARKGLRAGDVIVRAGDTATPTPADLVAAVEAAAANKRPSILLFLHRQSRVVAVPVQLSQANPAPN